MEPIQLYVYIRFLYHIKIVSELGPNIVMITHVECTPTTMQTIAARPGFWSSIFTIYVRVITMQSATKSGAYLRVKPCHQKLELSISPPPQTDSQALTDNSGFWWQGLTPITTWYHCVFASNVHNLRQNLSPLPPFCLNIPMNDSILSINSGNSYTPVKK